jgi:hypothetical protein
LEFVTSELYVSGSRKDFAKWAKEVSVWEPVDDKDGKTQLKRIEEIRVQPALEKLHNIPEDEEEIDTELVLNAGRSPETAIESLASFLVSVGGKREALGPVVHVGGLVFVAFHSNRALLAKLAAYALLRVARPR